MKKMVIGLSTVIVAIGLDACRARSANTDRPAASADFSGVYMGGLPCADCPGIQTKIEIKEDLTYVMQTNTLSILIDGEEEAGVLSEYYILRKVN